MTRYKYGAHVVCINGSYRESKTLEFIADEKIFLGTQEIHQLKIKALKVAKNQNRDEVSRFKKIEIESFYQGDKVESSQKNKFSSKKTSKYQTKRSPSKKLLSYNIFLIPFVLVWRIFKVLFNFLGSINRFLEK